MRTIFRSAAVSYGCIATALLFSAACSGGLPVSPAQGAASPGAAVRMPHMMRPRWPAAFRPDFSQSVNQNVKWHNGPVQVTPAVYVVFWGFGTDPSGEAPRLQAFFKAVGGSSWLSTVTQYYQGGNAHVTNPAGQLAGVWYDNTNPVPAIPTDAQVAREAGLLARHFNAFNPKAAYFVATPVGHDSKGFGKDFCSYHSDLYVNGVALAYTNFPYMTDAGQRCGENSVNNGSAGKLDGVTIIAGHELSETQTDPANGGWWDANGNEIADKCAWYDLANSNFGSAGTFPTQPLWSNAAERCVQ
jgi:hypothetical protein